MPTPHHPPVAVRRVLRKLAADILDARRRRRLPMAVVVERAFTSRRKSGVLLSQRFDKAGAIRVPFLSAMATMGPLAPGSRKDARESTGGRSGGKRDR
jgi:hypothetical protein